MAKTPEGKVKDEVKKILKQYAPHFSFYMPVHASFARAGIADFVCCCDGEFVAIETKATAQNKLTPLQLLYKNEVELSGGRFFIIHKDNIDTLANYLFSKSIWVRS